jgi:hypothetical protein
LSYLNSFKRAIVLEDLNSYFFNLNKWPIDKAPRVSNSSYLVGVGFVILFHAYALPSIEGLLLVSLSIFSFSVQISTILAFLAIYGIFSNSLSRQFFSRIFFVLVLIFLFVFFYYNGKILNSDLYRGNSLYLSNFLVINWDFYLFLLFFLGWVFKLSKKYSLESFTKQEALLYRTIAPSLFFFEFFTFCYVLVWRYMNSTLVGYPTTMYLKFYKGQHITGV